MERVSRRAIFAALAALAVLWAAIGSSRQDGFWNDIWAELFWLTIGVILITFILESILERDLQARRRKEDSFAFRTFAGALLDRLGTIATPSAGEASGHGSVRQAALTTPKEFATVAGAMSAKLATTTGVNGEAYNLHYLDMASGLRGFATNHIRLFSASREEMVDQYGRLMQLADKWRYQDVLRAESKAFTTSLAADDPRRVGLRQQERVAEAEAVALLRETAEVIAELARRATKPGVPSV